MAKKWYVIQTYSGYENKVHEALQQRIKEHAHGGPASARSSSRPRRSPEQRAGGKTRVRQKTSFPGYIFVEMEMSEEVWHLVKDTPKVTGFIGNQRPQEVTPPQIDDLRKSIVEGAVKPKPRVIVRGGRRDPRHRRRVRELLGHGRRGEARQAEAQGEGLDLRPRHAGRARFPPGGEAV